MSQVQRLRFAVAGLLGAVAVLLVVHVADAARLAGMESKIRSILLENQQRPVVNQQARGQAQEVDEAHQQRLTDAIAFGDALTVWRLLDGGASADSRACSEPALVRAARGGNARIVKMLLARGADMSARDGDGATARQVAERLARECREIDGKAPGISGEEFDRCPFRQETLRVLEQAESDREIASRFVSGSR